MINNNIISREDRFLKSVKINLANEVPERVRLLILADLKTPLTQEEQTHLDAYIARGGDVWILGEPGRQGVTNPVIASLGVAFMEGRLVQKQQGKAWDDIKASPALMARSNLEMPGCMGITYTAANKDFKVTPLFKSDPKGWNEVETTDFTDTSSIRLNPDAGEIQQAYPTVIVLTREQKGPEQRIIIFGDADCFSNARFNKRQNEINANNNVIVDFIDPKRLSNWEKWEYIRKIHQIYREDELRVDLKDLNVWRIILCWIAPAIGILAAWIILTRRKNR